MRWEIYCLTIVMLACQAQAMEIPPVDNLSTAKVVFWICSGVITVLSLGFGIFFTRDLNKNDEEKRLQAAAILDNAKEIAKVSERVAKVETIKNEEAERLRNDYDEHRHIHQRINVVEGRNNENEKAIAGINERCKEREKHEGT